MPLPVLAFVPHGHCYLWDPRLVWLHSLSDGLTALAYFSIPVALVYFVQQRRDLPYPWMFQLFGAFIVFCGLTHVMEIWTLWHPDYWVSGGVKSATAIVSLTTAATLIPVIPRAIALPSADELKLAKANLEDLVRDRTQLLEESRQQFQNLVENSPDIIERFDLNLRHLYVSPSLTRLTGLSAEAFLGKSCRDLGLDETMVNTWEAATNRLLATGEKQIIEFSTPTLKGIRTFEMVIAPEWAESRVGEPGAKIASVLCISRDITERKQTEQQLRDLSDRLSLALQSAKLGVWEWDPTSNQVVWDDWICELYGVSPSNHPRPFSEWEPLVHPDDFPHCQAEAWQALQDPTVNTGGIEFRIVRPDGSVCYIESYFLVQREETGQPKRLVGVNLDITERKRAEEALAASEQQLSTLISNLPGYVYRVQNDPDYTPLFISAGVEAVTGYRQDEYLVERSISCGQEVHPDDAEWVWALVQQAVGDRTPYECEYRIRTKTGEERWVWERGRGIYNDAGNLEWLEGFVTNISDRKIAEAELRAQKELLQITLDHLPVMVSVHSDTGNILLVNQTIEQTVGWTQAEHWTRDVLRECYPDPADYDRVTRHIAAADSTWQEFRLRTRDGRMIDTAWTQIPLPDGCSIGIGQDITERKQAEAARLQAETLQTELKLLETVLDSVLAGYWDYNLRKGTNYWSPGLKRMLGYAEDEIPHTLDNWERQILPEDLQKAKDCLERHVRSRGAEPYYNEVRYRHKDGSSVWVICAGQGIEWSESGELLRMVGCHVDITQLKHIEAQLRISEGHLQEAQRIGNIGSWEFDVQTEQITWSEQIFHIFRRDLALGTPEDFAAFQQLVYPSDREFYAQTVQTLIATHQPYDIELRICRGDGSIGYVQARGEAMLNAAGCLRKLRGTVLDITERKLAEEERRLLTDRLTLALKAGEIGTWDWNTNHEITWDDRMYEIYGLQRLQALGRPVQYREWCDRLHLDDLVSTETALQAALLGEGDYDVEFRIWRTDGELRWIKANGIVQRDAHGNPISMTGINYDITKRKRAEAEILQKSIQLEASNRELEAFAYSVSHDLRSPLRAIDGFSRALLEDYGHQFDDEGRDYFNRIRHNVQRMGMLIDDLLSLSRVSRAEMRHVAVNLSAIAQELLQELQTAEPERQIECIIAPDVIVWADPSLMRVVLSNLLQNAWKFTSHHPTARIEFGIIKQDEQPTYFVQDDGAGFDMAYSSMLFGVFQRLHNMTEFPGTGIGLATVQRIIHRHGGQVWAEAAVEQGATFYFTLPTPVLEARFDP
ncbi:PAS domain-containing protein [Thermoleptolyngbya sp. C42_A2020_037]|uniref:PAS domain-containing protein n=1 Tax=Thermoleptolyngbya sp. C42_A2020_037 TaxID=2747799 RepID=UPI0019FD636C|nr:PAS domain-containing protein [Thermoleptolyngbya sp. C42_A2020_037]MBF2086828.1 PAS domain-containing protein [Thermoleptolyngbya sp. C42_A2020_037]